LSHPNSVFHGDTLLCETEVLDVKPSSTKPDLGVVEVHTQALNQDGLLVTEFKRLVLGAEQAGVGPDIQCGGCVSTTTGEDGVVRLRFCKEPHWARPSALEGG
jgi:hypothetical protein